MKKIMVIIDGGGDLPIAQFAGKTAFESAETPNLDFFAKNGKMGLMYPINEKIAPGSDTALISIFGNDPKLFRRGSYEALGADFKLTRGDLALRTNFGTIQNLKNKIVVDRRAGRTITTAEARALVATLNEKIKLPCEFELKSTIQHRGVLVLRGGFSDNITSIDPEWSGGGKKFRFSAPLDNEENSKYTSNILNEFISQAFKILNNHPINLERQRKGMLPINMVFMRGGGVEIPKINQYRSWMSINYMPLEIGIAMASGMKNFAFEYPKLKNIDVYENLYEGLNKAIAFAKKTILEEHEDFIGCYVQFKEPDVPGHDNKPYEKKNMMEVIDRDFFGFLKRFVKDKKIKVVVSCDHSTPCANKGHSSDPVPVLLYGEGADEVETFSEKEAFNGGLGVFHGEKFMEKTGLNK